jgi:hypothetical protein
MAQQEQRTVEFSFPADDDLTMTAAVNRPREEPIGPEHLGPAERTVEGTAGAVVTTTESSEASVHEEIWEWDIDDRQMARVAEQPLIAFHCRHFEFIESDSDHVESSGNVAIQDAMKVDVATNKRNRETRTLHESPMGQPKKYWRDEDGSGDQPVHLHVSFMAAVSTSSMVVRMEEDVMVVSNKRGRDETPRRQESSPGEVSRPPKYCRDEDSEPLSEPLRLEMSHSSTEVQTITDTGIRQVDEATVESKEGEKENVAAHEEPLMGAESSHTEIRSEEASPSTD